MKASLWRALPLTALLLGLGGCANDTETKTIETTVEVIAACSPTHPSGACETAGDICYEGACVAADSLCSATNLTGTCPSGTTCFAGGCVVESELCSATNTVGVCESGKSCLDGACVASADLCSPSNTTGECPDGATCFFGGCIIQTEACSPNNVEGVCPSGTVCFGGGCVLESALCSPSALDGPCELGSVCMDGVCVFRSSLCSETNHEGLCPEGEECLAGICGVPAVDPCTVEVYKDQPTIGVHTDVTTKAKLTVDGLEFRDASGDGALDVYEDWRLNELCRAKDLVSKMDLAQKIGLLSEGSRVGSGTADGTVPDNVRTALIDRHERYALIRLGQRSATELAT